MCFSCLNLAENGSGTLKFATGQNRQIPLKRLIACGRGSFIDEENCRLLIAMLCMRIYCYGKTLCR